ncbi:MAG: hypothetical protein HYZ68_04405 [Chloroflexi bacterium]|nr:hypothetical protein [Chloroflexota bacterium]
MPKYIDLLVEYQRRADPLLEEYQVFENLGLLPIEQDAFYGIFLKELISRPRKFDMQRLNLAAWVQNVSFEHFRSYCLKYGANAQLPALFDWHYTFFDRMGRLVDLLEAADSSRQEKMAALWRVAQEPELARRRERAARLLKARALS